MNKAFDSFISSYELDEKDKVLLVSQERILTSSAGAKEHSDEELDETFSEIYMSLKKLDWQETSPEALLKDPSAFEKVQVLVWNGVKPADIQKNFLEAVSRLSDLIILTISGQNWYLKEKDEAEEAFSAYQYYNINFDMQDCLVFSKMSQEEAFRYYRRRLESETRSNHVKDAQMDKLNKKLKSEEKWNFVAHDLENSTLWKATKPVRAGLNYIKKEAAKLPAGKYAIKFADNLQENGLADTLRKSYRKVLSVASPSHREDYSYISEERRKREESHLFSKDMRFSILVPVYNTDEVFLKEMIQSVQHQTYPEWELCLADGSDAKHAYVEQVIREFQKSDNRIKYEKLKKNKGISENTNACFRMATGNYISLFDHDDLLHPSALYETALAIEDHGADFVYTDEAVFLEDDIRHILILHFKPDFSIDNLRANNYICHFTSFDRRLVEGEALERTLYDGAQDHDLFLRLTAKAQKVFHVRKLLYFWRSHATSTAGHVSAKPYASRAGVRAVSDSLKANGLKAAVTSHERTPTIYQIHYELESEPLVSIIIPSNGQDRLVVSHCLMSILYGTKYPHYEVLIVENRPERLESSPYYQEIKGNDKVRILADPEVSEAAMLNFGASKARGSYLVFMSCHTMVKSKDWISQMLQYAQRKDVGAVGLRMLYPDDTIHHAGLIIGVSKNLVACSHYHVPCDSPGYMGRMIYSQNMAAVTKDCLMIRKDLLEKLGGLDEGYMAEYYDADLCIRALNEGLLNVYSPYADLYYYPTAHGKKVYQEQDRDLFAAKWKEWIKKGDPFYNPNFSHKTPFEIDYSKINQED